MKKVIIFLFCLVSLSFFAYKIDVVTEQYPPFSYEKDGVVGGISTEIVQAVLEELRIESKIETSRWSTAYRKAQKNANVLLYSIGRTSERENLFHWIGVVAPFDIYFYSLSNRSDITIESMDDLKKYSIGVVKGDMRDQFFKINKGFNIKRYKDSQAIIKDLVAGKIDLMPAAELNFPYIVDHFGYADDQFEKLFLFEELSEEGLYMAFGNKTSIDIVKDFKNALNSIKEKGIYDKIINSYLTK